MSRQNEPQVNPIQTLLQLEAQLVHCFETFWHEQGAPKGALHYEKKATGRSWRAHEEQNQLFGELLDAYDVGAEGNKLGLMCEQWNDEQLHRAHQTLLQCMTHWRLHVDEKQARQIHPKQWQKLGARVRAVVQQYEQRYTLSSALTSEQDVWTAHMAQLSKQVGQSLSSVQILKAYVRIGVWLVMAGVDVNELYGTRSPSASGGMFSKLNPHCWLECAWTCPPGHEQYPIDWLKKMHADVLALQHNGELDGAPEKAWQRVAKSYAKQYPAVRLILQALDKKMLEECGLTQWLWYREDPQAIEALGQWMKSANPLTRWSQMSLRIPQPSGARHLWSQCIVEHQQEWFKSNRGLDALEALVRAGEFECAQQLYQADPQMPMRCVQEQAQQRYGKEHIGPLTWVSQVELEAEGTQAQNWWTFLEQTGLWAQIQQQPTEHARCVYEWSGLVKSEQGCALLQKISAGLDVRLPLRGAPSDSVHQLGKSMLHKMLIEGMPLQQQRQWFGVNPKPLSMWSMEGGSVKGSMGWSVLKRVIKKTHDTLLSARNKLPGAQHSEAVPSSVEQEQLDDQRILKLCQWSCDALMQEVKQAVTTGVQVPVPVETVGQVLLELAGHQRVDAFNVLLDTLVQMPEGAQYVQEHLPQVCNALVQDAVQDKEHEQKVCAIVQLLCEHKLDWSVSVAHRWMGKTHYPVLQWLVLKMQEDQQRALGTWEQEEGACALGVCAVVLEQLVASGVDMTPLANWEQKSVLMDEVQRHVLELIARYDKVKIEQQLAGSTGQMAVGKSSAVRL